MKKIRKFRIKLRPASVLRGLKALMEKTQVTPELEKAVEAEITHSQEIFSTAALYRNFGKDSAPEWASVFWEKANEKGTKPMAITIYVSTIGIEIEDSLSDALSRGEGLRSQILTAVGEEAAEQSANFVYRLLSEEVRGESFDLSGKNNEELPEQRRNFLSFVESDKVQISMDNMNHMTPRFTRTGYVLWYPKKKKK